MKKPKFYTLALLHSYFDTGYGTTSYLKYLIAFFGLASRDVNTTLWIAVGYGILCFIVGWIVFRSGYAKAKMEVGNQYNMFVEEMRKKVVTKR